MKYLCEECQWYGEALLEAPNSFNAEHTIIGCPQCFDVNCIAVACDEPGCRTVASCGFPVSGGYRQTCRQHYISDRKGAE